MTLEIAVGPPTLVISQGHAVLVAEQDGTIRWPTNKGLYFFDTRLICRWEIFANGGPWDLLNSGNITHYAARVFLTNRTIATEDGPIPPHTLALELGRSIGGGIHEDLDIVNYGTKPVRFNLELVIRSDFADLFEVKANRVVTRGRITTEWSEHAARLRMTYRNQDFRRAMTVQARRNDSPLAYANGRIRFEVSLRPRESWHACLLYQLRDGQRRFEAPAGCVAGAEQSEVGRRLTDWKRTVLKIRTTSEEIQRLYDQAVEDIATLRLPIEGGDRMRFVPAAGAPWFLALFGRDSLIASIQTAIIYPDFAVATLAALGALQARERDDYRDAEPGKIMHELRQGELAHFGLIPHTPYYGTADATMLYLVALHTAWCATGDTALLERHLATAERCLDWIDRCGDRDGDGFQEYATRSPAGYENQGWKDSGDAVVDLDGAPVAGPKALCELQGYVYDARLRMAEVFAALGKPDRAQALRAQASSLRDRFNEAFWDEESGFYAYALDGDKRKVLTVASNPGHCLWSGIVPPDRAGRVVRRLMRPDMWSGWGIRTLSADNPAYNPYSYQNGSVWPHDNAIIATGFRRYGFAAEAAEVARGVWAAGSYFMQHRMPELYGGLPRLPMTFPVQYLGANVPQAWAAGSIFAFLQAILGLVPDAPRGLLHVDPALPDEIPELAAVDLRVGKRRFDLRFWREGRTTRWEVTSGDKEAVAQRSFADRKGA